MKVCRNVVLLCIAFVINFISYSCAQVFSYKELSNIPDFVEKYDEIDQFERIIKSSKFVEAVDYLPKNHVRDGTVDYTAYLQEAINEQQNILMPDFPILINDKGLELRDNMKILFRSNSKLLLKASSEPRYEILRIHNRKNIKIFSPKIIGDRDLHLADHGEWGMGISIRGSSEIEIVNAAISKCWGDGIYIGTAQGKSSKNIHINYGIIDENRRNGISVISVENLMMTNMIISNTNGTNPQAAIDFEPNDSSEVLKNISLKNIYTYNNFHQGIFYCLNHLNGNIKNSVCIRLENHMDRYSRVAIGLMNVVPNDKPVKYIISGNLDFVNIAGINNIDFRVFDNSKLENLTIKIKKDLKNSDAFRTQGDVKGIMYL